MNEMRFNQTIRALSEDLEARLINYLSNLQEKSKNLKNFDAVNSLKEIVDISMNIKSEWTNSKCTSDFLEKLFAQTSILKNLCSGKMNDCVSLYLSLSTSILNVKKFLDKLLKDESVLKIKCRRVEERDRLQTNRNPEEKDGCTSPRPLTSVRERNNSRERKSNTRQPQVIDPY